MKKEAILHIPLSQYAYAVGEHTLVIRIRTAKGDIKECDLYYGDRVDQQKEIRVRKLAMEKVASDDLFDYYETRIEDRYTRICYYFMLDDGEEKLYYYERNFCRELACERTEYFQFPYIRREDILSVPEWAKDTVMYHIFPDSFANGPCRMQLQELNGKCLGGNIRGIIDNLNYLSGLGINCIYLNPIFSASSYHRYDTVDYLSVEPELGTLDEVKELVRSCHDRGIRVLFDGVFNHCGSEFFAFQDVLQKGKESKYYDWFYYMPEPVSYTDPPSYEAFAYVKEMPKLNTGNPEVEDYLIKVGTYWIREVGIDGWRLDVANEINHDFWRHFRTAIRRERPDALLIGEIWEDAGAWLMGDQFDSTMNYRFSYLCKDFFADQTMSVSQFDEQIQKMIFRYPEQVSLAQMNFLDSHDVPRFLSYCKGDRRKMRLAYFYLFMAYGIPSVFYGDEYYIEGTTEPEYRRPMPWQQEDNASALFAEWISLRNEHSALRRGRYQTVLCDDERGIYVFSRRDEQETVIVILNNSETDYFPQDQFWQTIAERTGRQPGDRPGRFAAFSGQVL